MIWRKISGKLACRGNAGYETPLIPPDYTGRIDDAAASPEPAQMQIADDSAAADFVLVDDGDTGAACEATTAKSIRSRLILKPPTPT